MSNRLLHATSALALIAGLASAAPARAQLADVAIEGPITAIDLTPGSGTLGGAPVTWIGEMTVMGVTIRVRDTAEVHTPTNDAVSLADLAGDPLPGRSGAGFIGGTAIVTGDSEAGIIYANDVFSDFAENVLVGEATGIVEDTQGENTVQRATVNRMIVQASSDPRMPAGPPINGFGFAIDPGNLGNGSLVAVEGYFAEDRLYYHTLEADSGVLLHPEIAEVSVLRASCRKRGGGRDELQVRGGTHTPANARVRIQYFNGTDWVNVAPLVTPVVDNTVVPAQGLYNYNNTGLRLPGTVCPAQIRATILGGTVVSEAFAPDSR
jgi:hypothetical protein